jgi:transposase
MRRMPKVKNIAVQAGGFCGNCLARPGRRSCGQAALRDKVNDVIAALGCDLRYLPPYRPDFNPIENAFSKLKAHLHATAERSVGALWSSVGEIVKLFEPQECANYFAVAEYDPD